MKRLFTLWLIFVSILFITQCKPNDAEISAQSALTTYDSILQYFSARQKRSFNNHYTKLFVINENGCIGCNKSYFELIKQNLKDSNCLFLLGSIGSYLDASGIDSNKNVYIDESLLETDYSVFHNSKVFFFGLNSIDTIINISAVNIEKQFDIIEKRKPH